MAFVMLGVVVVFPLVDEETPTALYVLLPMTILYLLMETAKSRR